MVAAFKELVFDFGDLRSLNIICTNCQTETTINLSKPPSKERMPDRCKPCRADFGENFIRAINDFCSAYKTFTEGVQERPIKARLKIVRELKDSDF